MAAPEFAYVLADKLAQDVVRAWSDGPAPVRTRPIAPDRARFPWTPSLTSHLGAVPQSYKTEATRAVRPAPVELTPEQREALSVLRQLGATLNDDFSRAQLKKAFRRLALALHPDRHPSASHRSRAQLSGRFADLCRAYRTLSPVI